MSPLPSDPALSDAPPVSFYRSEPAPCPYLAGRIERKLFGRLGQGAEAALVHSALTEAGFRRSQNIVYRPTCPTCTACQPVRIDLVHFKPHGTLSRIARKTQNLNFAPAPQGFDTTSLFPMFKAYQLARHGESEMAHMSEADFLEMIANTLGTTTLFLLSAPQDAPSPPPLIVGALLADSINKPDGSLDGWSAVYSFFAVDDASDALSLGSALVLKLAAHAQALAAPYLYLGYYIKNSEKMAYKKRFAPLQTLTPSGHWENLD